MDGFAHAFLFSGMPQTLPFSRYRHCSPESNVKQRSILLRCFTFNRFTHCSIYKMAGGISIVFFEHLKKVTVVFISYLICNL